MEDNFTKALADSMRIQGLAILLSSPSVGDLPRSVKKRILYVLIEASGVKLTKEELEEMESRANAAPDGRVAIQQSKRIPRDPSEEP